MAAAETKNKDLQKMNHFLIDTFNDREKLVNEEVEVVREALSSLQIAFDS